MSIKHDIDCNLDNFVADEKKTRIIVMSMSHSPVFKDTMSEIQSWLPLCKNDKLSHVTSFLDSDVLVRVEGRIKKSELYVITIVPWYSTASAELPKPIIETAHYNCGLHGTENIHKQFWETFEVVRIRRALRDFGKCCFICRRWRPVKVIQKVVSLPVFRFPEHSKLYPFVIRYVAMSELFHVERSKTQLVYVCIN